MGTHTIDAGSSNAPKYAPAGFGGAFEDVEQVVGRIQRELQVLRTEHAAIAKRIGLIKNTIAGLAEVFGPVVAGLEQQGLLAEEPVKRRRRGLTNACRELLRETSAPQTLKQISERIEERYPDLVTHHRYPRTIIQMMLRRLVMYGEAEEMDAGTGLRSWRASSVHPR
ncbi:MAG: hypothetical protein WA604_21315 [Candidatus Sulfotelmatobacter sp.]